jgi:hypothetical protein
MVSAKIYGYAVGKNSRSICNHIAHELLSVDWQLGHYQPKLFANNMKHADLLVIVANLSCTDGPINIEQMVKLAENLAVATVVFFLHPKQQLNKLRSIMPRDIAEQRDGMGCWERIERKAIIFQLDRYSPYNNLLEVTPLINQYLASDLDILSIKLLFLLKSIVEPITRQELIGVDFADYRLAFANKGLYQTRLCTSEVLFKIQENNDNWLKAKVIIVTIFLNTDHALDVFSTTSSSICYRLKGSNALLLIAPVISERVQGEPIISIIYKL